MTNEPPPRSTNPRLCLSHPDYHLPPELPAGEHFDGEAYARRFAENGADGLVFFAMCHYGHAYYPTQVGRPHPKLRKDLLAEFLRGTRKYNLRSVVYFSVFLNVAAIEEHPEWKIQSERDLTDAGFDSGNFRGRICVNSGYLEEWLIPMVEEALDRYRFDELFFDTMSGFQACYCDACERKYGAPIPEPTTGQEWVRYLKWYRKCYDRFFERAIQAIQAKNKTVEVAFNWCWSYRQPGPLPDGARPSVRLSADRTASEVVADMACRYFAGTGLPFDYMTGRFMHGLGEWNNNTRASLRITAATTIANGGGFYLIDRQLPEGGLEERGFDAMRDVFSFINERKPVLADARPLGREVAVLHSYRSLYGADERFFSDVERRGKRLYSYEGFIRMMMNCGRHTTILNDETILSRLDEFSLLILPEVEELAPTTLHHIQRWVENGGRLVFTQSTEDSGIYEKFFDWAGLQYHGKSESSGGYCKFANCDLLLYNLLHVAPVNGGELLRRVYRPLSLKDGRKFGHGYAPIGEPSDFALVSKREIGKGVLFYIAAPLFRDYCRRQNHHWAQLVLDTVDQALPEPVAAVTAYASHLARGERTVEATIPENLPNVGLSLARQENDLIVHLVNHSGRERLADHFYPILEYLPELADVAVSIKTDGRDLEIDPLPAGTIHQVRPSAPYTTVHVSLHYMTSLLVRHYFV